MNMSKFVFRDYADDDFDGVRDLWQLTGMAGSQRGDNNEVIRNTLNNGGKLIIMEDTASGKIIGTSWLTNDGRRIYLHHFGILPEYQGQGLSKPLLEKSLEFAKEKGLQIKLEVHKTNLKAIDLYKKGGFKYLGDYLVYIIRSIGKY